MHRYDKTEVHDAVLITRAQRGDRDAFGMLYTRYIDLIFRYVRSRVADGQTAEDITEAVFLRSFESIERYRDRGLRYSAYLYQVARNLLVDHYRRGEQNLPLESAEYSSSEAFSSDGEIILREQAARLRAAMERLPDDYQEIIRMRILLEMPTAEVAVWLGRREGATRVLLHRALKALKQEVESDYE
jgi:RNA polymerase sigma-70 factor (ECF subfamily)